MPDDLLTLQARYDRLTSECAQLQRTLDATQQERMRVFRELERGMKKPVVGNGERR